MGRWGKLLLSFCSAVHVSSLKVTSRSNMAAGVPATMSTFRAVGRRKGQRGTAPRLTDSLQGTFWEVPYNILFTSCDPPEFLWCLNWNCIEFITRYEKCYHLNISPSGKLSQATYTFEINCIVSIDQTRHLSKKYNKNAHCLFYALI